MLIRGITWIYNRNREDSADIRRKEHLNGQKHCSTCDVWKPANNSYFTRKSDRWDKLNPICKQCNKLYAVRSKESRKKVSAKRYTNKKEHIKATNKKWKKENPDKYKEINRRYAKSSKGRLKKLMLQQKRDALKKELIADLTAEQWFETINYFNSRCAYCENEGFLTQDHFIPLSQGGIYSKKNIIPACESCNSKKGTKDFFTWYRGYEHYSEAREKKILEFIKK